MLRLRRKSSAKWRQSDRLPKSWPELQNPYHAARTRESPPPELPLIQAKLSRNSNQIARGQIRRFESYMPSQADRSRPRKMWADQRRLGKLAVGHRRPTAET